MATQILLALLCTVSVYSAPYYLQVSGSQFKLNGNQIFLNGANEPWDQYGNDFGNNQPNSVFCSLNDTLQNMHSFSGNSIRMWLFCEGSEIPEFDTNGNVIGTDKAGTLISDMILYLEAAAKANILVFFSLWNGAVHIEGNEKGIIEDDTKMQSFINNALIPMVKAFKNQTALGGYEIFNEPEGSVAIASDSNKCYDTTGLKGTGAGWTGSNIKMYNLQRFTNKVTAAIHKEDQKALVTVGSWSEHASTDSFGYTNYWKDSCLQSAGSESNGILDFYQIHCYSWNGKYGSTQPFVQKASAYNLNKPLIIGEFNVQAGNPPPFNNNTEQYKYLYQNGYQGAWEWGMTDCGGCDGQSICDKGMNVLKGQNGIAITVSGSDAINLKPRCG